MDDSKDDELARYLKSSTGTEKKKKEIPSPPLSRATSRAPVARVFPVSSDIMKKVLTRRDRPVLPGGMNLKRVLGGMFLVLLTLATAYYYMQASVPLPRPLLSFEGSEILAKAAGGSGSLTIVVHNTGQGGARISSVLVTDDAHQPVLEILFPDEHCGGFNCVIFSEAGSSVANNFLIVPPDATVNVAKVYSDSTPFRPGASYSVTVSILDSDDANFVIQSKLNP